MRKATNMGRDELISLGTCFGKFTKTRKFKLHITALDYLAQYAKVSPPPAKKGATTALLQSNSIIYFNQQYKVWVKPAAEMSFLYGNHISKAGLGRITEDTPQCALSLLSSFLASLFFLILPISFLLFYHSKSDAFFLFFFFFCF